MNQTKIIFQHIVLVFTASLVFYSQCQIDQTSAGWLKYIFFFLISHCEVKVVKLQCHWDTFPDCTRFATEAGWVIPLPPYLNSLSKFTGLLFFLFFFNNREKEWVQILSPVLFSARISSQALHEGRKVGSMYKDLSCMMALGFLKETLTKK